VHIVGGMLFGIQASQDVKLGKPKTVSITSHFKERRNSITGARPVPPQLFANQIFRNALGGDRPASNNIC